MTKGFIYVAVSPKTSPSPHKFNWNKKRINKEFLHSFKTLRIHHPSYPVTLFTDYDDLLDLNLEGYNAKKIDNDWGFLPKVHGIHSSPYDKFIFLDCDTQVNHKLDEVFDILDDFDVIAAREYNKDIVNTGVLGINKMTIAGKNFLNLWLDKMKSKKEYAKKKSKEGGISNKIPDDQAEFNDILRIVSKDPKSYTMRKIQKDLEDLRFQVISSSIYNCRGKEFSNLSEEDLNKTKIFHMRGLA